ncbi:MAG: 4Fe-4S dicluster domain-containing protein [Caldisericia bacterium]|nr:4Fe-4S dicluster domain-containing protein [Caldisericia bacterium]
MLIKIGREVNLLDFGKELEKESGTDIRKCYQCGKCTAGCPMNFEMDISPSQIIRFSQLGMKEKVLNSRTIWYCIFCETCSTRCPQGVDIKGVMDGLRRMAVARNIKPKSKTRFLEKAFQSIIYMFGRVYEPGMVGEYNLRSKELLHDVPLFPLMLKKRKISLKIHTKRAKEIRTMMKRAKKIRERKLKETEGSK